jgi:hypothetical protein
MGMAFLIIWFAASVLPSTLVIGSNFQIRRSGFVVSTNLDTPDIFQNEKMPAASVHPASLGIINSPTSASTKATKSRQDDSSYQLNRVFLL